MAYAMWLMYRLLNRKRLEKDGRRIKNVIFDVGNVLVDYDWKTYLKGFHFPEEEEKKLAKEIFQSDIWNERDKGLYDEEEYIRRFMKAPRIQKITIGLQERKHLRRSVGFMLEPGYSI